MKILIIHANKNLNLHRRTLINLSYCLLKYAPDNDYYLHCYDFKDLDKSFSGIEKEDFDAIIFDVSFIDATRNLVLKNVRDKFYQKYDFIKNSDAIKLAFPQDDYTYTKYINDLFEHFNVDVIFSLYSNQKEVMYPNLYEKVKIIPALAGYVDDDDIRIIQDFVKPFNERNIDVGYRTKKNRPNYGRFFLMKSELGNNFKEKTSKLSKDNLILDVSNDPNDTLGGSDWFRFLGNTKFTLGCEGGSSILDWTGKISFLSRNHLIRYPHTTFEHMEEKFFAGEDYKYLFNVISPRVFESAISKNCQILVEGSYNNVIKPWVHYIPLKQDFSNVDEVLTVMKDYDKVNELIENAYSDLILSGKYSYRNFVKQILETIDQKKNTSSDTSFSLMEKPCCNEEIIEIVEPANIMAGKKQYQSVRIIKKIPSIIRKIMIAVYSMYNQLKVKFFGDKIYY